MNQAIIDAVYEMVLAEMRGVILMWSGAIATIPTGWVLCDGNNGTPDLRDQFIVCANADDAGVAKSSVSGMPQQSGGDAYHDHTYNSGTHLHYSKAGYTVDSGSTREVWDRESPNNTTSLESTGGITNDSVTIAVPFYAIAYIMKT